MARLSVAAARGMMPAYASKLLTSFAAEKQVRETALAESASFLSRSLTGPLSRRELEVKRRTAAIARGRELGLLQRASRLHRSLPPPPRKQHSERHFRVYAPRGGMGMPLSQTIKGGRS